MALADLRPYILRLRAAQNRLETARRDLTAAQTEHTAARQELDDALINEFRNVS